MPLGMLGKYERLDVLGHGASGIVYLAKDTLLGRLIALKEIAAQGEERERVLEEARVLDRLRHPHIVRVYGLDEIGGKIVLAMEYVAGRNLQEVLRRRETLPIEEAVEITAQVCEGLGYAHRNRIVHRDIKPANILIAEDGTVKIVDFGLAQVLGTNSFAGGAGTYAYMAPEDFHEESLSDHQADIWAAGVILYEMLTGRRPFQAAKIKDPFSWKRAIEESPLVPAHELRPDVSPALDVILERALARDKSARYADASEMAADLHALFPAAAKILAGETPSPFSLPALDPQPVSSASAGLWSPFADQPGVRHIDDFLHLAPSHWEEARTALLSGSLIQWLKINGEVPLAEVAEQIREMQGQSDDNRLREFLYRAGLDTGPEAYRAYEEGMRSVRHGLFSEAIPAFTQAVHLDPSQRRYHEDRIAALRAAASQEEMPAALDEAIRNFPHIREFRRQKEQLQDAQASLSSDRIDFGTLRQGQIKTAGVTLTKRGGGTAEGRVASAPPWIKVQPLSFTTRRRQRLTITADTAHTGTVPAELQEEILLEIGGRAQPIRVRATVLPARRSFHTVFWWYLPLLLCCLLPTMMGGKAQISFFPGLDNAGPSPGAGASVLLLAALFIVTSAADTEWTLRLIPLLLLGLTAWGTAPIMADFASSTNLPLRAAFVQTAIPALVMLVLEAFAVSSAPRGWGRWPLWAWVTGATGLLVSYALGHTAYPR